MLRSRACRSRGTSNPKKAPINISYTQLTLEQCRGRGLGADPPHAVENLPITFDSPKNPYTNSLLLTRSLANNKQLISTLFLCYIHTVYYILFSYNKSRQKRICCPLESNRWANIFGIGKRKRQESQSRSMPKQRKVTLPKCAIFGKDETICCTVTFQQFNLNLQLRRMCFTVSGSF